MMTAAVVTVSDGASLGTRVDTSGPAVAARLEGAGFTVVERKIVPDERGEIAAGLRAIADPGSARVIFTTGGTGIALRDVTPEATRDVIDRELPGFGEVMRSRGLEKTRFAPLSRALAGTRGAVLIVNLPGSPRGAVESLDAILELVPHVLDLLGGHTEHTVPGRSKEATEA
jgi:molybdenum cofactor synthesis domain-containing protein